MLKYVPENLSPETMATLAALQARVDAMPTHSEKYEQANSLFKSKTNSAFKEIKAKLAALAPGDDACFYCERDRYRDIEHIRPKRHYPQHCFDWNNYLYACPICNQDKKNDTFAVFDATGEVLRFNRTLPITAPVPVGAQVLIDLRAEDPLDFLQLDFETGRFSPIGDAVAKTRGKYTRDLFDLNDSCLARHRKLAFGSFKDYLSRYQGAVMQNKPSLTASILDEILKLPHPTVLVEMRRQTIFSSELSALFEGVPAHIGARP